VNYHSSSCGAAFFTPQNANPHQPAFLEKTIMDEHSQKLWRKSKTGKLHGKERAYGHTALDINFLLVIVYPTLANTADTCIFSMKT